MDAAKKHIVQRDFEQAAKDLDKLEPLVEQSKARNVNGIMADGSTPAATAPADSDIITAGGSQAAPAAPESGLPAASIDVEEPPNPVFETAQRSAAPADSGSGRGGKPPGREGGSGKPTGREEQIKQLREWDKKGKIDGDVAGLEKRLRSKDPKTIEDAQHEFNDAWEEINVRKGRFHVHEQIPPAAPKPEGMSTPGKIELGKIPMVKTLVPDKARQAALGDWIAANHDVVAQIATRLGVKGWTGVQDGHGHLTKRPDFAEAVVREWQKGEGAASMTVEEMEERQKRDPSWKPNEEQSKKLEQARSKKGGGGTGGSGGHEPTKKEGSGGGGGQDGGNGPNNKKGSTQANKAQQGPAKPTATNSNNPQEPATSKGGGDPKAPPATPAKTPTSPATAPQAFDASKFQQSVAEVFRQVQAGKKLFDDIQQQLKKSRSPAESKKLREKLGKVGKELQGKRRVEIESLAKQLATAPEMAGIAGGTPKETISKARERFSKVASGGRAMGPALLKLQTAFALVDGIGEILTATSAAERMAKALKLGTGIAAGTAEYALANYVAGSSVVAWVAVGVLGMKSDQASDPQAERRLAKMRAVDEMLEKTVPGYNDLDTNSKLDLRDEVVRQVDQMRREQLAQQAKDRGIWDGLAGTTTDKGDLEPELTDKQDIGITQKDLMLAYQEGIADGKRQREAAIKRAHDAGVNDGKAGKPANFEAVKQWHEFQALLHKPQNKLSNDEFKSVASVEHAYSASYDKGYQEGVKTGKAMVTALVISPKGLTMGYYAGRVLKANLMFSNRSTKEVTGEVRWTSSDDKIVKLSVYDNGMAAAWGIGIGGAEITASYAGILGSHAATIKVTVNPPRIVVDPDKITLGVGAKQPFLADSVDEAQDVVLAMANDLRLDSSVIAWGSDDNTKISIDQDGNAIVLAASARPVTIFASHKFSPAQGRAIVTIR
jgi:hypothetical protein